MSEIREYTHIAIALCAVWFIYKRLWLPQRVDVLREKLFALRQELFEVASDGRIAFSDPAYIRLRSLLNANIRFAHKATGARVLVSTIVSPFEPGENSKTCEWCRAVYNEHVPSDVREQLLSIHIRMAQHIAWHIILGSPILTTIAALYNARTIRARRSDANCHSRVGEIAQVGLVEREAMIEACAATA